MTKKILKIMEDAGLTHRGYSPEDHIVHRMLDGLEPLEFYRELCNAVNPIFEKKYIKYSVNENKIILTRNHIIPPRDYGVAKTISFLKLLPLDVRVARGDERINTFDDNRLFVGDPKVNYFSYLGTAELLKRAARASLKG